MRVNREEMCGKVLRLHLKERLAKSTIASG
jgi:hypothetical protein